MILHSAQMVSCIEKAQIPRNVPHCSNIYGTRMCPVHVVDNIMYVSCISFYAFCQKSYQVFCSKVALLWRWRWGNAWIVFPLLGTRNAACISIIDLCKLHEFRKKHQNKYAELAIISTNTFWQCNPLASNKGIRIFKA